MDFSVLLYCNTTEKCCLGVLQPEDTPIGLPCLKSPLLKKGQSSEGEKMLQNWAANPIFV